MRLRLPTICTTGLLCLLLAACGSMEVHTRPDSGFTRESPVAIALHQDRVGIGAKLTSRLVGKGFRVVDEASARRAARRESRADAERARSYAYGHASRDGGRHDTAPYRYAGYGDEPMYRGATRFEDAPRRTASLEPRYVLDVAYEVRSKSRLFREPKHTVTSLSARITDLETGEIVLSAAFGGKRSPDDAVDRLIRKIEKRLD